MAVCFWYIKDYILGKILISSDTNLLICLDKLRVLWLVIITYLTKLSYCTTLVALRSSVDTIFDDFLTDSKTTFLV